MAGKALRVVYKCNNQQFSVTSHICSTFLLHSALPRSNSPLHWDHNSGRRLNSSNRRLGLFVDRRWDRLNKFAVASGLGWDVGDAKGAGVSGVAEAGHNLGELFGVVWVQEMLGVTKADLFEKPA